MIHFILMICFLVQVLGLNPVLNTRNKVSHAAVSSAYNSISEQPSPLLHLRVSQDLLKQYNLKFSIVSNKQIRLNGHLFDLISIGIFVDFIDLRIVLNDSNQSKNLASLVKNMSHEKGGLKTNVAQQFIPFTPPVTFAISHSIVTSQNQKIWPIFSEDLRVGFFNLTGQPPRA